MLNDFIELNGRHIQNRVVIQPMEGSDCNFDGSPSEHTALKYTNYARSGAGIVWFEASAVCPEGRTNLRQMRVTEENADKFRALLRSLREISLRENGFAPLFILQLTHSGRQSIKPMTVYRNEIYEKTKPVPDGSIVSDEYLDSVPAMFAAAAELAEYAGFDGVDVKCCHGYLLQEALSAFSREGKYGGSFENRIRLYTDCFRAVKGKVSSRFIVASRLGLSDMVKKPYGFGTDEQGNLDLSEGKALLSRLTGEGLELINVTLGNPYYNPHINRPFRVGAYTAPESPETGLKRFRDVEKAVKDEFPELKVVASGLSYYRNELMEKAEALLRDKVCDFVGFGRCSLAYPMFYKDYLRGAFDPKKCCVACSKCTFLMRAHCISGCATFDDYYRKLYKEKVL